MADANPAPNLSAWARDHAQRYLASNGKEGHIWGQGNPAYAKGTQTMLLLTVTGRKSGGRLIFPLIYGKSGSNYVVVASKGGAPVHPGWYLNLVADPRVEVQVADKKFSARARTAVGEERRVIWEQMAGQFPPYAEYQRATPREIPVVILEPQA